LRRKLLSLHSQRAKNRRRLSTARVSTSLKPASGVAVLEIRRICPRSADAQISRTQRCSQFAAPGLTQIYGRPVLIKVRGRADSRRSLRGGQIFIRLPEPAARHFQHLNVGRLASRVDSADNRHRCRIHDSGHIGRRCRRVAGESGYNGPCRGWQRGTLRSIHDRSTSMARR